MAGAGAGTSNGSLADPPMPSMAEFTQQMKEDAENQQCLVPIVAKLLAKLVEENDKVLISCYTSLLGCILCRLTDIGVCSYPRIRRSRSSTHRKLQP